MNGNDFLIPFRPIHNGLFSFPFPLPVLALFSFPFPFVIPIPSHPYSLTTTANTSKYVPTKRKNNMVLIINNIMTAVLVVFPAFGQQRRKHVTGRISAAFP